MGLTVSYPTPAYIRHWWPGIGYCCIVFCDAVRNAESIRAVFWAKTGEKIGMHHGMGGLLELL
jgi:hypothetical protein